MYCMRVVQYQLLAARRGFEPRMTAPKTDVLPLHHRAFKRYDSIVI